MGIINPNQQPQQMTTQQLVNQLLNQNAMLSQKLAEVEMSEKERFGVLLESLPHESRANFEYLMMKQQVFHVRKARWLAKDSADLDGFRHFGEIFDSLKGQMQPLQHLKDDEGNETGQTIGSEWHKEYKSGFEQGSADFANWLEKNDLKEH